MSQRHYVYAAATGAGGFVSRRSPPLPLGLVGFEAKVDAKGGALWIQAAVIDWLNSPRRPGESYSDVIPRPHMKVRSCRQGRGSVLSTSATPILLSRDWPSTVRPLEAQDGGGGAFGPMIVGVMNWPSARRFVSTRNFRVT